MLDKLKQLTKDTAIYGVSTIVGRFLNFILVPFYTNIFLPEEYGIVSYIYSYIAILNIVFIYGMDSAYLKFASTTEIGNGKDNFSTPLLSVAVTSLIFGMLFLIFKGNFLELFRIPGKFSYLLYYVILILMADALAVIPFIYLRLAGNAKKFAAFKLLNISVNILFNIYLIIILKWGIESIFIANLIASLSSLLLLFPSIAKNFRFKFHFTLFKRLLKFGLPYLPAGLAVMVIQVIDRPILEYLTDMSTVGIYQANYKLGIFMMLFVAMFQYAWQPFFLTNAKEENAKEIFSKVLTYFSIAGSIILIILSLFIDDFVRIKFTGISIIGSNYWSGLNIVPAILFAYLFNGLYVIFSAGIYIEEKSIYVPVVTVIGAAVNIGANFALIPLMGIMGAALATLAAYVVMAVGFYIVTQKFYKINYEKEKIAKLFFIIMIIGGIYYFLLSVDSLLIVYKILLLILFAALLYLFNIFEKKEIVYMKKLLSLKRLS